MSDSEVSEYQQLQENRRRLEQELADEEAAQDQKLTNATLALQEVEEQKALEQQLAQEIQERMASIQAEIASINAQETLDATDLSTFKETLSKSTDTTELEISTLETSIAELQAEIDAGTESYSDSGDESAALRTLQSTIRDLRGNNQKEEKLRNSLQSQIDTLNDEIASLERGILIQMGEIAASSSGSEETGLQALDTTLKALQQALADAESKSTKDVRNAKPDEDNSDIKRLRQEVDQLGTQLNSMRTLTEKMVKSVASAVTGAASAVTGAASAVLGRLIGK
jgi:chromosome segregation ATPase